MELACVPFDKKATRSAQWPRGDIPAPIIVLSIGPMCYITLDALYLFKVLFCHSQNQLAIACICGLVCLGRRSLK
jgi:hypothetical protein